MFKTMFITLFGMYLLGMCVSAFICYLHHGSF